MGNHLTLEQCLANWCYHGWYSRAFSAREASWERQRSSSYNERRGYPQVPAKHQEVLKLRTNAVAAGWSIAIDGL